MTEIEEVMSEIEKELGLNTGFFLDLKKDDDWSFLIKSHALMESVCSYLLTSYFNDAKFKDIFSRIEMSDMKIGKIAFLRAAGLIEKDEARFIRGLSELRNKVVHNIEGVNFKFLDHINKLDKNQRKNFADTFGYVYAEEDQDGTRSINDHHRILSSPKLAIWWGAMMLLTMLKMKIETHHFKEEAKKYKLEILEHIRALTKTKK